MQFVLKISGDQGGERTVDLRPGEVMVGRSRSAGIRVYAQDVSGRQFALYVDENEVRISNLSHYGTMVDGELLNQERQLLKVGACVQAGMTMIFELQVKAAAMVEPEEMVEEDTSVTRLVNAKVSTSTVSSLIGHVKSPRMDVGEETGATQFAAPQEAADVGEETGATQFAGKNENSGVDTALMAEVEGYGDAQEPAWDVEEASAKEAEKAATGTLDGRIGEPELEKADPEATRFDEPPEMNSTPVAGDAMQPDSAEGEYEDAEDGEQTGGNETKAVQTRMANLDEINYIRKQIQSQRQSRIFLRFILFVFLLGMVALIWFWRAPRREKYLSWESKIVGTEYEPSKESKNSYANEGFSIYYPSWQGLVTDWNPVTRPAADTIQINTFLGKKPEVPLVLTLRRWVEPQNLRCSHDDAWKLLRQKHLPEDEFHEETMPTTDFFTPRDNTRSGNGILYTSMSFSHIVQYSQSPTSKWFGFMYFFRDGQFSYLMMAEVPDTEKERAMPIFEDNYFVRFSHNMERLHWSGDGKYEEITNIDEALAKIEDELTSGSDTEFYYCERALRQCLIQLTESGAAKDSQQYEKALRLLGQLRIAEQNTYNQLRNAWLNAPTEAAKTEARNGGLLRFMGFEDRRYSKIIQW